MERCPILNNNFQIATLDEVPLQTVLPDFTEETLEAVEELRSNSESFDLEGFWPLSHGDKSVPMVWVKVHQRVIGLDTRDSLGKIITENYLQKGIAIPVLINEEQPV